MVQIILHLCYYGIFVSLVYLVAMLCRCELVFAWYDLWVGVFIDRSKCRWYLFLIPCIGVKYPDNLRESVRDYKAPEIPMAHNSRFYHPPKHTKILRCPDCDSESWLYWKDYVHHWKCPVCEHVHAVD